MLWGQGDSSGHSNYIAAGRQTFDHLHTSVFLYHGIKRTPVHGKRTKY